MQYNITTVLPSATPMMHQQLIHARPTIHHIRLVIGAKFIVPEDRNATAGKTVRVRWGCQSRVWKAVVVGLEADLESHKRAATPERVPEAKKNNNKKQRGGCITR